MRPRPSAPTDGLNSAKPPATLRCAIAGSPPSAAQIISFSSSTSLAARARSNQKGSSERQLAQVIRCFWDFSDKRFEYQRSGSVHDRGPPPAILCKPEVYRAQAKPAGGWRATVSGHDAGRGCCGGCVARSPFGGTADGGSMMLASL